MCCESFLIWVEFRRVEEKRFPRSGKYYFCYLAKNTQDKKFKKKTENENENCLSVKIKEGRRRNHEMKMYK